VPPLLPRYRLSEQRVEDERKLDEILLEGDEVEAVAGMAYAGQPTVTPECEREVSRLSGESLEAAPHPAPIRWRRSWRRRPRGELRLGR
jgi:hypothetical protein